MLATVHTMSSGAQFFFYGVAFVLLVVAALFYAIAQAKPLKWAPVLACAGLACYVLVFAWNAAVA